MIREEIQKGKLRERAENRSWGFEKRLEEEKGSELARLCCEKMRGRAREGKPAQIGKRREGNSLKIEDGRLERWKRKKKKMMLGLAS